MMRRLFNLLVGASLGLFLLFLMIGVRSFVKADGWTWSDGVRVDTAGYSIAWRKSLVVQWGRVYYVADRGMGARNAFTSHLEPRLADFAVQMYGSGPWDFSFLGISHRVQTGYAFIANVIKPPPVDITHVWVIPLWPIVLLTAILPSLWLVKIVRAGRRTGSMCCKHCGYDLRASPERCPECGTIRSTSQDASL
jgi:hypothetical protein